MKYGKVHIEGKDDKALCGRIGVYATKYGDVIDGCKTCKKIDNAKWDYIAKLLKEV